MVFKKVNGWNTTTLGDCCKEKPSYGINAAAVEFNKELPRYIRITDIDDYGRFSPNKLTSVNEKDWEDFVLRRDDVLFVRTGSTTGKSYLYQEKDGELVYAGFLIKFSVDKSILLPYYLKLFTETDFYNQWVSIMSVRSGQPGINSKEYNLLPIQLPPLKEQQKIAQILSQWDEAIATTQTLIEKLQWRKKGLMQALLSGKKRLAGFSEEWKEVTINQCLKESKIPSKEDLIDKRISVKLNLKGIVAREIKGTEAINSTAYFIRKAGQFVYGKQNLHKGAMGIIPKELNNYESTQDIPTFDFKDKIDPKWFLFYVSRPNFYLRLENISTGTGSKRIHPKSLFKVKIKLPNLKEQKAISKIIGVADTEIEEKKAYLLKLKKQKKGLMQQLLTGKKRVKL